MKLISFDDLDTYTSSINSASMDILENTVLTFLL